jgi:hypothetical protein
MDTPDVEFVAFPNVPIVSDGDILTIAIAGQSYTVPMSEVAPVIRLRPVGESGTIVVRKQFAARLGLI